VRYAFARLTKVLPRVEISLFFVVAANNVPFISVNGNESITGQWTVLEENSITFSTSDVDGDTVTMYAWMPLPAGSSLSKVQDSDLWKFVWTPTNMDSVELM